MQTNGDIMRAQAERAGIPPVSIWKAKEGLTLAKKNKADKALARLMLNHGRLTDEARAWIAKEYPQ
ncbi:MAG: hypothetical protein PS018_11535 [bacterium]|nr:hypothetical protein [bacterium]